MTRTVGGSGRSDDPSAGFGWHSHIFVLKPAMLAFTYFCAEASDEQIQGHVLMPCAFGSAKHQGQM